MATWKKVIVSGSTANLANVQVDGLTSGNVVIGGGTAGNLTTTAINGTGNIVATTAATGLVHSGSFSGSFQGNFVGTTNLPDLTQGTGITAFTYDGATTATVAVSGASTLNSNKISKWTGAAFADSSLTDNGTAITGTTSLQLTGASSNLSGSFSGSFFGDGSGLSGVAASFPVTAKTDLVNTDKFFINDGASKFVTYGSLLTDLAGTNLTVEATDSLTLATTITGLTSVTSTTFVGNLTGTATTASYVVTAQTASYVNGNIFTSANPVTSASYALSSSLASTVTTNANLSGDVTSAGNVTTLASVASAGTTGGSTAIPVITINAKGLTTSITTAAVVAPAGTLSGATLASNVLTSSLTSVGTLSSLTATNAVITNNLTVQGTASFQNTTNLEVADRFVLFASGSNTTGDGGIVVQQGTQNVGELYGYESSINRWGFTSSFTANQSSFTPAAYITTTEFAASNPSAAPIYGGASNGLGNIHVNSSTGDIFIYA